MKRILPLLLALVSALSLLSPALAADVEGLFPASNPYPGFIDVEAGAWYESAARICCETGLMQGTGQAFAPDQILTTGETAAIAARINETLTGDQIPPPVPDPYLPWYQHYMDYLAGLGLALPDGAAQATRLDFLKLLAAVLPDSLLMPVNQIDTLPDTDDADILRFYNAGILTGLDSYGTFAGGKALTRAECAAMLARIVRPGLRQGFSPDDYSAFLAADLKPSDILFQGDGVTVSAGAFLDAVCGSIYDQERSLQQSGVEFNWHYTAPGEQSVLEQVKETVLAELAVTPDMGTQAYKDFDYQVFYSRLIDLLGGPLGAGA